MIGNLWSFSGNMTKTLNLREILELQDGSNILWLLQAPLDKSANDGYLRIFNQKLENPRILMLLRFYLKSLFWPNYVLKIRLIKRLSIWKFISQPKFWCWLNSPMSKFRHRASENVKTRNSSQVFMSSFSQLISRKI